MFILCCPASGWEWLLLLPIWLVLMDIERFVFDTIKAMIVICWYILFRYSHDVLKCASRSLLSVYTIICGSCVTVLYVASNTPFDLPAPPRFTFYLAVLSLSVLCCNSELEWLLFPPFWLMLLDVECFLYDRITAYSKSLLVVCWYRLFALHWVVRCAPRFLLISIFIHSGFLPHPMQNQLLCCFYGDACPILPSGVGVAHRSLVCIPNRNVIWGYYLNS